MNANEQFLVRHYAEDEKPILKGHGFDGLVIGDDRQEAQEFVDSLNSMLSQQQAEIEALKKLISEMKYEKSSGVYEMNNEPVAWIDKDGKIFYTNGIAHTLPLYTHPSKELIEEKSYEVIFDGEKYTTKLVEPKVKELTDAEIQQISHRYHYTYNPDYIGFARAILRKAQEK